MAGGWLKATRQDCTRILVAGGDWALPSLVRLDAELRETVTAEPGLSAARIDLSDLTRLDTGGAWLLVRTERRLAAMGVALAMEGVRARHAELLRLARTTATEPLPPMPQARGFLDLVAHVGEESLRIGREAALLLSFFGRICVTLGRTMVQPWRLRGTALVRQIELTGIDALPIVGLLSFLIGIVLAFQGADQLRRFGAEIFTVNLLGVSVLRELGVLLTAIIVAGRSGSAFTAQIGAMQVNQEIDALRTIGLDPVEVLVVPRLLALVITLPLLAFFANFMALVGGGLMVVLTLDIPLAQFMRQLSGAISTQMLWVGLVKAPVFAFLIAMVGCFEGMRVTGSAESVGRLTTTSVVVSIFLVILVDALFSILFAQLKI
jgi:phospholipid/cholesterol/gamma-HCH transport system permease protein